MLVVDLLESPWGATRVRWFLGSKTGKQDWEAKSGQGWWQVTRNVFFDVHGSNDALVAIQSRMSNNAALTAGDITPLARPQHCTPAHFSIPAVDACVLLRKKWIHAAFCTRPQCDMSRWNHAAGGLTPLLDALVSTAGGLTPLLDAALPVEEAMAPTKVAWWHRLRGTDVAKLKTWFLALLIQRAVTRCWFLNFVRP